ncbi:MAG: hypothetical protein GTO45_30280 [Candidatus Aminicenantes bacterium]|nr:hypothetical protein [Candidatus Aminicenantes bacterium]NIM83081.1 hypothetical protein [Candidatus Aminicenantes bacterium]NIN22460.1 hypothetical protein [Candidatus Aminicenantes bacterium]NIN46228.1 hypothetical protein [Candidatus Aminicenantes bacterium]NIN89065.1 hypothetical protein [Candidatus Aminicenantes bacterium]
MINLIIGALVTAGLLLLVNYSRKHRLRVAWWQWTITVPGFAYAAFVLAMIAAFLEEGAARAAVVIGTIFGFIAVIWGVLLARFVFKSERR